MNRSKTCAKILQSCRKYNTEYTKRVGGKLFSDRGVDNK